MNGHNSDEARREVGLHAARSAGKCSQALLTLAASATITDPSDFLGSFTKAKEAVSGHVYRDATPMSPSDIPNQITQGIDLVEKVHSDNPGKAVASVAIELTVWLRKQMIVTSRSTGWPEPGVSSGEPATSWNLACLTGRLV